MTENGQIILGICLLIAVYFLTRKINLWRVKRTYMFIIKDLEQKGAVDPLLAVPLSYAKINIFRAGMKDFRPKALEYLVSSDIVGKTEDGRYYLKDKGASFIPIK